MNKYQLEQLGKTIFKRCPKAVEFFSELKSHNVDINNITDTEANEIIKCLLIINR